MIFAEVFDYLTLDKSIVTAEPLLQKVKNTKRDGNAEGKEHKLFDFCFIKHIFIFLLDIKIFCVRVMNNNRRSRLFRVKLEFLR